MESSTAGNGSFELVVVDDDDDAVSVLHDDDDALHMLILVWTVVIMITGCLGNVLVVSAVWLNRNLRNVGNIFIVNLAVADMAVSSIVNGFCIVGIVTKAQFFVDREWLCESIAIICITCCTCSMWSIAAIGVNRYVCICHWSKYREIYNRRTTPIMLLAVWAISFLIDLPNILGWGDHRFDWKTMVCTGDMAVEYSYTIFFTALGFGVPLLVIVYSYIRICYHAWRSTSRLNEVTIQDGVLSGRSSDLRLARSILIIVIVFCAMWAPYALTIIIDRETIAHRSVYIFSALLAHTNSSINCIIYAATNRNFRKGYAHFFNIVFCGTSRCGPHPLPLNTSLVTGCTASQKSINLIEEEHRV